MMQAVLDGADLSTVGFMFDFPFLFIFFSSISFFLIFSLDFLQKF